MREREIELKMGGEIENHRRGHKINLIWYRKSYIYVNTNMSNNKCVLRNKLFLISNLTINMV